MIMSIDEQNLVYEDNAKFNDYLDGEYELVEIAGQEFRPSEVLYEMSKGSYTIALQEFKEKEISDLKQTIFNNFPTPIAVCFYRFENGFENNIQRLHFLRDTWESVINFLHALVIGNFRYKCLNIADSGVKFNDLFTDKISIKLLTIERLLQFAENADLNLECNDFIPIDTIQDMRELNRERNEFSHSAALSENQARKIIIENIDEVQSLLMSLMDCTPDSRQ